MENPESPVAAYEVFRSDVPHINVAGAHFESELPKSCADGYHPPCNIVFFQLYELHLHQSYIDAECDMCLWTPRIRHAEDPARRYSVLPAC